MKKKIMAWFLCMALIAALLPTPAALAADTDQYGGTVDSEGVLRFDCYILDIPSGAYGGRTDIKEVIFPDSLLDIGNGAFKDCTSLTKVTIPDGVEQIGEYAFQHCWQLQSVTIPGSVTILGKYIFGDCRSLTSAELQLGVPKIANAMFHMCVSLTSVSIPLSVSSIDKDAFSGCAMLSAISLPDSVTSIGSDAFNGCGFTAVDLPDNVTSIDYHAFSGCANLTSMTIPDRVQTVSAYLFYNCTNLTSVTIPGDVTAIGDGAFCGCESLTSLTLPSGITGINRSAFDGCRKLASITIPGGVTSIGVSTFKGCESFTSLAIPSGVTSIGSGAFTNCLGLEFVNIPDGVNSIESSTFMGCESLASLTLPSGVKSIGESAFDGCSSLSSITIPNGVSRIPWRAFRGCVSLTSIVIPDAVTSVGVNSYGTNGGAFVDCVNLKSITVGTGMVGKDLKFPGSSDGGAYEIWVLSTDNSLIITPDTATGKAEIPLAGTYLSESLAGSTPMTQHTLTDESSPGVTLSGMLSNDATMTISALSLPAPGGDAACDAIRDRIADPDETLLFSMDLTLSGEYSGPLTLVIPVGLSYNGRTVVLLHAKNGVLETFSAVVSNGQATLTVTGLSPFALFLEQPSASPATMTLTTTRAAGSSIMLSLQANEADKADVWVDLNNNGAKDAGEENVGMYKTYAVNAQTIPIHGKVTLLSCRSNGLTALDVSQNTALTSLDVYDNALTALDVSQNTALTSLNFSNNQVAALDISYNTALKTLICSGNPVSSLDLSVNTQLTNLQCANCGLSVLDVSNQTALAELNCRNNSLSALDLTDNTALTSIYCTNNALTSLLLPASATVKRLECEKNLLTTLDVSHITQVTVLNCAVNALSSLDVSQNTKLMQLKVYGNAIKGAAMTALMNGLPTVSSAYKLYVIDTAASPADGNVALVSDVAVATGKGWSVLDWKGGYEETYTGSASTHSCVCEIVGGDQYETLDAAISDVPVNTLTTIRLLQTISRTSTLTVGNGKKITLDLNGFDLTVTAAAGAALDVGYGGSLTTSGTGSLNLMGVDFGITAHDGGSADITGSVTATGNTQNHENGSGVLANGSGSGVSVVVKGSVTGDMCGLNVYNGAQVTVTGNVTAHNVAVSADTGGQIHISGSVTGSGVGVGADSATVEITGSVTASGSAGCGIFADKAAAVTVGAGVTAGQQGVSATYQSQVTVAGDITVTNGADGGAAVIAETSSEVSVGGSVTGGACGVSAETGGNIDVQGNVRGHYCGIDVSKGADVTVLGNVIADGTAAVGVYAYDAATATVDGYVQAYKAVFVGESGGALVTPTALPGYLTYSDGGEHPSYVWLKENTAPVIETGEVLDLTATGALVLGKAESGLEVTERGVVYATAPDPTIDTGTVVPAQAAGTGEYDTLLTGLTANTTYYVRAYAKNALGSSYGACLSFTTPVAVSVVPAGSLPQNLVFNSVSNKLYIANNIGNSVTVINGSTDAVLATIPVGKAPYHVAVNEMTNRIYVPNNMANTVSVIDGSTDTVMATVSVGNAPRASAVNKKTDKIYVVNFTAASVSVIDGATNTVTATIPVGSRPYSVAVNETTNRIYVANYWGDSISVIDGTTDTVTATVTAGAYPRHIAINEVTNRIYVVNYRGASVTVINGADNSTQTVPLATNAYPWAAAVNETTNKTYVTNSGTNTVTVISGDNTTVTISAGKAPQAVAVNEATNAVNIGNYSADSRSRAGYIVTKIDGATNSIVGFACASNPAELAVNEGENKTYIMASNGVTVIDEAGASPFTVAGAASDDTAITQIDNRTPSARDKTWALDVTTGTVKADVSSSDVTLTGLPKGFGYNAAKGEGNSIVITLTGAAWSVLAADASVTAVIKGSAVIESGARNSSGIALNLWYIGPENSFALTNEGASRFIDEVEGEGCHSLYQALVYLYDQLPSDAPATLSARMSRLIKILESCPADSEVFTFTLHSFTGAGNSPVGVNADGTYIRAGFSVLSYHGSAGYETYGGDVRYTYPTDFSQGGICIGSNEVDLGGGVTFEYEYRAFAVAWMPADADPVCEIGSTQYETLDAAVAAVLASTPTTIRLLKTIDRTSTLILDGSKKITLNLNGYNLNITAASGAGLEVKAGASLTTEGAGALNASGFIYGIYAVEGAVVNITGDVSATGGHTEQSGSATGIYAYEAAGVPVSVKISGIVHGYIGVIAASGAEVIVNGGIIGETAGIRVLNGGDITVSGNVTATAATDDSCIMMYSGTVHVGGNITAEGADSDGIYAANAATLTVGGSVSAVRYGIRAYSSTVNVAESVSTTSASSPSTVYAGTSSVLNIGGDVAGAGDCGVIAETNAKVTVTGIIQSKYTGIRVSTGSEVFALGDVIADNTVGVGVNAFETGEATIEGTIQAHKNIIFGESDSALVTPTTKPGYLTYSDGLVDPSSVWVKDTAAAPPTVSTTTVGSGGVTQTTAYVSGTVTTHGTVTETEYGFVYGKAENPAIGGVGVTRLMFGSGVTLTDVAFGLTLTGLTANTAYHVRAYAINGGVTQYGEDRTFTTKAAAAGELPETGVLGATDYTAVVEKNHVQVSTLPVDADSVSGTGVVVLDTALAAELFAAPADIGIIVPQITGITSIRLDLPAPQLKNTPAASRLMLDTTYGSVTLPGAMLKTLAGDAQKTIEIIVGEGDSKDLSEAEKTAAGDRPLIALSLALDGKQSGWSDRSMPVTVTIPYTPTEAESTQSECLIIWRADGDGDPVCIPNGRYDAALGGMIFKTSQFSIFACGFNKVTFNDVSEDIWYGVPVDFIAARLITTGTGGGKFSPDRNLTRSEYLVMLMRALELAPDNSPKDNFADAGSAYYTGFLAAAKRLGIAAGVGDNRFAPDRAVTRQEMLTMMYNALRVINQLPDGVPGSPRPTLNGFTDADRVAPWALDAVKRLVETGIVSGIGGRLAPEDRATRAEMAQILCNLLTR
jgi:YVTN family beta-propeller protein